MFEADGPAAAESAYYSAVGTHIGSLAQTVVSNLNIGPVIKSLYSGRYDQQNVAQTLADNGYDPGGYSCCEPELSCADCLPGTVTCHADATVVWEKQQASCSNYSILSQQQTGHDVEVTWQVTTPQSCTIRSVHGVLQESQNAWAVQLLEGELVSGSGLCTWLGLDVTDPGNWGTTRGWTTQSTWLSCMQASYDSAGQGGPYHIDLTADNSAAVYRVKFRILSRVTL